MGAVSTALERVRPPRAKELAKVERPIVPRTITAAAAQIPLDGTGWKEFKLGDSKWQKDGWHQYDINGDLRFIANWVGDACSRSELFIAEVGPDGKPGDRTQDAEIQILAETVFGGPAAKAEAMRLLGIHLFVPGESYIVAESVETADQDRWYVVSTSDIKREGQTAIKVKRPQEYGGDWYELKASADLLIRVWTPHPRKPDIADSSVRPALIPLREIEQLTKYLFAQIDSRLAGAGVAFVPQEMDFPREEEDPAGAAEGLTALMTRAMSQALQDREAASSLVPVFVEVPAELIGKIQHMSFETPLSERIESLQDAATRKLARCLDVDPEILLGKGESNHWTAWQVEESTIRLFVATKLARMCDALTKGYLAAALKVMGKDPEKYCFWYSTDALTVTPDRQGDALELYDKGLIGAQATRAAGNWSEDEAPDDAERERELARKMVELDPALIREAPIQKALGVSWKLSEPAPPAAPPGAPDQANSPDQPGGAAPQTGRQAPRQIPDREQSAQQASLMVGSHAAIQRTLELVGKRLLTRENRGKYADVAAWSLHTQIRVMGDEHARELVAAALPDLTVTAAYAEVDTDTLEDLVGTYCLELVKRGVDHNASLLATYLEAGLHAECGDRCLHPAHPGRCEPEARAYAVDLDPEVDTYHLPGRHNQKTHGHRTGRARSTGPGIGPFTPAEKATRAARRRATPYDDPDRDASAQDRQGRRAWAEWSQEARRLNGEIDREQKRDIERVVDRPKPKAKTAREAEWEKREAELRESQEKRLANIQRRLDALKGEPPETEDDLGFNQAELRSMYEAIEQGFAERLETERGNFFGTNPDEITGNGILSSWSRNLREDTTPGKPVPVRNLTGLGDGGYTMKRGWAIRRGRLRFAVEVDSPAEAEKVADQLAAAHAKLPSDADDYQSVYVWAAGANDGDVRWQQRFKNKNHVAFASAGGGTVNLWGRQSKYGGRPLDSIGESILVHEFGHNRDRGPKGEHHGISESPEWEAAQKKDGPRYTDANGEPKASAPFRDFYSSTANHPIDLRTTRGKEVPHGVTSYGKSSKQEDFAESLMLYHAGSVGSARFKQADGEISSFYDPVLFRDLFPDRAAILDAMYPEEAKRQKAIVAERRRKRGFRS